ncbi:MAG: hypothetical protein Q8P83_00760 [bacterium]|nr:hypothetical protein [bacterium]
MIFNSKDIKSIKSVSEFISKAVMDQIKGVILEDINTGDFDDCGEIYKALTLKIQEFKNSIPKEQSKVYEELSKLAEIGIARFFSGQKQSKFYMDSILLLLKYNLNLQEVFEPGLMLTFDLDNTDKKAVRNMLEKNSELLGKEPLFIKGHESALSPTLGNWLLDYRVILGEKDFDITNTYSKAFYYSNNSNYKKLNPQNQRILQKIIDFYSWVHKPTPIMTASIPTLRSQTGKQTIQQIKSVSERNFEPLQHGESIEDLRAKLKSSPVDFAKKIPAPFKPRPSTSGPNPIQKEIKREVETPELPSPPTIRIPELDSGSGKRASELNLELQNRQSAAQAKMALKSLDEIKTIEDLKKIEVGHLHQGEPNQQVEKIKSKIFDLARVNNLLPYHVVSVFEQSPLFKQYLFLGGSLVTDHRQDRKIAFSEAVARLKASGQQAMSLAEFEAVADLRKEIERL